MSVLIREIKTGVLLMKDGKAWGVSYSDAHATEYGWVSPLKADLADPRYVKEPADLIYKGDPCAKEALTGKLVAVARVVSIELV